MRENFGLKLLAFGEYKTLREWSEDSRCLVTFKTLSSRFRGRNWGLEKSLNSPLRYKKSSDYIGKVFNYLLIEKIVKTDKKNNIVLCKCIYKNCGNKLELPFHYAQKKHSCGCLARENHLKRITKHGQDKNPMLHIWYNLNSRCYNPNYESFSNYGARGIFVCEEWKWKQHNEIGLLNFLKWCENNPRPNKKFSLDRIDNDGPYSSQNCRWATLSEQCKNRRNLKYFEQKLKEKDLIITDLQNQIATLKL